MRRSATVMVAAFLITLGGCFAPEQPASRQAEVAEKGASVMPFDLDKTTHRFLPADGGLRQEVVADQPGDTQQITAIREHLTSEANRFRRGDFSDPASIHGENMPGLAELAAGADRITVTYTDLPDGAALDFRTTDPILIQALHAWAKAQTVDHGSHAEGPR